MAQADAQSARVIEAAPVLIWSAGLDRSNDWFSPSWSAYTGRDPSSELRGDGWTRSVHPEDLDRCLGIRATSFEARAPFSMDLRLRRHDGEYRWMLDNGVPRFGADGAAIGYVGSCVDIHERKELEETLAERTQAAAPGRAPPGPVPGDALARAAQPARADRQRRQRAANAREQQPDPGPPARDPRAPGRAASAS